MILLNFSLNCKQKLFTIDSNQLPFGMSESIFKSWACTLWVSFWISPRKCRTWASRIERSDSLRERLSWSCHQARSFWSCSNFLIIPITYQRKPEKSRKQFNYLFAQSYRLITGTLFSYFIAQSCRGGAPPAPNYLIVMDLGGGGRDAEAPSWHFTNQADESIGCPFRQASKLTEWKPNPVMPLTLSLVVGVFQPASVANTRPLTSLRTISLPCSQTLSPSVRVLPMVLALRCSNASFICCVTFLIIQLFLWLFQL